MEITVNGVPTLAVPVDGCRYRCAISCNDATVEPRSRIPSPPTPPSTAHLIRFFLSSAALALGRIVIGMLTVFKKTNVNFQFWFAGEKFDRVNFNGLTFSHCASFQNQSCATGETLQFSNFMVLRPLVMVLMLKMSPCPTGFPARVASHGGRGSNSSSSNTALNATTATCDVPCSGPYAALPECLRRGCASDLSLLGRSVHLDW
ncbi:Dynamin family [Musa troglodytarum]|uniref:Dynamin family n=1 Tax=Musa troglodytarum TaxID=320322 RepID=A0A9E7FW94_9LILI|nr:Dynamin family [Musa troglodytarum]